MDPSRDFVVYWFGVYGYHWGTFEISLAGGVDLCRDIFFHQEIFDGKSNGFTDQVDFLYR